MKFIVIFVVFVFGYIQTNVESVSECYYCMSVSSVKCDEPVTQKCPTDNICLSAKLANDVDGSFLEVKECIPNNSVILEGCAVFNQTDDGGYCYTCSEDLCNLP